MFVIINPQMIVVDAASHAANLSYGYQLAGVLEKDDAALIGAGYKKIEIKGQASLEDTIDDSGAEPIVIVNTEKQNEIRLRGIRLEVIDKTLQRDGAIGLNYTTEITYYNQELSDLLAEKAKLENL